MFLIILLGALVVPPSARAEDFNVFTTEKPIVYGPTSQITCGADQGVCVPTDQCRNGRVVEDGVILNTRLQDSCKKNEVCCKLPTDNNRGTKPFNNPADRPVGKPVDEPVDNPINTPVDIPAIQKLTNAPLKGCGVRQESGISFRHLGVDTALSGEFSWVVAIFQIKYHTEKYLCGGSLIHPRVVLTAALPVVRAKRLVVRAGAYDLMDTHEFYPYQTIEVESVTRHSNFNSARFSHNIALLFLAKEVQPAPNVGYACLPRSTELADHGTDCIVTGWGQRTLSDNATENVLKMLELPIVNMDKCLHQLRTAVNPRVMLDSTNICAGGDGIDTCKGDAGSPLVCPYPGDSDRYYQAGITSAGVDCGANYIPGVYTSVAALRDWVDSKMAEKGFDQSTYTRPS